MDMTASLTIPGMAPLIGHLHRYAVLGAEGRRLRVCRYEPGGVRVVWQHPAPLTPEALLTVLGDMAAVQDIVTVHGAHDDAWMACAADGRMAGPEGRGITETAAITDLIGKLLADMDEPETAPK